MHRLRVVQIAGIALVIRECRAEIPHAKKRQTSGKKEQHYDEKTRDSPRLRIFFENPQYVAIYPSEHNQKNETARVTFHQGLSRPDSGIEGRISKHTLIAPSYPLLCAVTGDACGVGRSAGHRDGRDACGVAVGAPQFAMVWWRSYRAPVLAPAVCTRPQSRKRTTNRTDRVIRLHRVQSNFAHLNDSASSPGGTACRLTGGPIITGKVLVF